MYPEKVRCMVFFYTFVAYSVCYETDFKKLIPYPQLKNALQLKAIVIFG